MCDRMVQAAIELQENHGGSGEIRLGTEVKEIRVDQGRVLGVTLKEGMGIESAAVVSNADYKTTFMKLINPNTIPEDWYQVVVHTKQTSSNLQVCLGVDINRVDLSSFK